MATKSRADKYFLPTGISLIGGLLIIAPLFLKIPSDYATFVAKDTLNKSETINRDRIAQRKATADLIKKTGLLPFGRTLRIIDYDDGHKPPKLTRQTLQHYLADEVVFVYDRSSTCIGKIQNRRFIWKRDSSTVCNDAPVINSDSEY
ncbi:hypothetical protein F7734_39045 [Scytonema sp. UIC 10036]|uniref:hypothetical protein n=1 Tax=Scytonema sp. UIC 10036 TaxID=2304196 RepID=UPI0012DA97AF|nr:hypothetical protein [Scytonema sp. UIC 10036]MUG97989.1 hypothetical protein [Scytonema sp. UIC 10036]